MWIGLVANVPYYPILRLIKNVIKSNGKLYNSETGAEMTSSLRNVVN